MSRSVKFKLFMALLLGALGGVLFFGFLVWRAVSIEELSSEEATARFARARAAFGQAEALLIRDEDGRIHRNPKAPEPRPGRLSTLHVLAWRERNHRLARLDVPFWFLKLKGPAAGFVATGTGVDIEEFGLTPADLQHQGPGIVFDGAGRRGDRLLVWTD